MIILKFQSLKYLDGKSSNQILRDSLKIIVFNKFVQIDR
jgi:hypothetical protein